MLIPCKHSGYSRSGVRLCFKKDGGSAPPPDPALIAAQIKSLGTQDKALERLLANSEQMQPLLKAQTQFGLDSAKTAFEQAQADRTYSLERRGELTRLQDQKVSDSESFNAEAKGEKYAAEAVADVGIQAGMARQAQTRSLQRAGVNPASGKMLAIQNASSLTEAAAKAGASNNARKAARLEGFSLNDRASNALAGYPAMGMATTGSGAGFGASGINIAATGQNAMNAGFGSVVSGAGAMGSNATNAFNSQANYKLQSDSMANQQDGALMSSLGTVAGMWMAGSSKTFKKNFRGLNPGEGLDMVEDIPVKRWTYKEDSGYYDGGREHIGPMAEDVQRVAGDEAAPKGKQIDLVNLNGITMSAIQDLSREVKTLKRLLFTGGMKQPQIAEAA